MPRTLPPDHSESRLHPLASTVEVSYGWSVELSGTIFTVVSLSSLAFSGLASAVISRQAPGEGVSKWDKHVERLGVRGQSLPWLSRRHI